MKRLILRPIAIVASSCLIGIAALAQQSTWQIDPAHSSAQFAVKHMMVSTVRGTFDKFSGSVQYDPKDITKSSVEATLDASSIDTRNESRDNDLRSQNFFDVQKFPTLTFKSKSVQAAGAGKIKVVGDLTIHGVTKEVTLDVDGPTPPIKDRNGLRMGLSGTTRINRKDFGLLYNRVVEAGAVVGDEITITLDVELVSRS